MAARATIYRRTSDETARGRTAGRARAPRLERYAAFLRGVTPMNAKMPELRQAFEAAGFEEVRTVLSSGNVVFSAPAQAEAALERQAEAAMKKRLGNVFATIVRRVDALRDLLASDPYRNVRLEPGAKRVVTFLCHPASVRLMLPIELHGSRILLLRDGEVFSAYVPSPRGAVFMTLIEKTLGKEVTTRTWDTVARVAREGSISEPESRRRSATGSPRRRPTPRAE
ncbi:MAG TPA: DUF1697 domain-containing protein [Anaeromyxobacteraceae bacterium]|nr:DUF1697 domain-containing protein [Anaeromyxobacteraceae bacterium]